MKKTLFCILVIVLVLGVLLGCTGSASERYGYVHSVEEDGFVAEFDNFGYIYVKYSGTDLKIGKFGTVIVKFSQSDLEETSGVFVDLYDEENRYSYVLESAKSIRLKKKKKKEPTFG